MELILSWDAIVTLKIPVDTLFAVHPNIRRHAGNMMIVRQGAFCPCSAKQTLNTRSSTKAELVAVDDMLPQALWTRNFTKVQKYHIEETVMHQDNLSTIMLTYK